VQTLNHAQSINRISTIRFIRYDTTPDCDRMTPKEKPTTHCSLRYPWHLVEMNWTLIDVGSEVVATALCWHSRRREQDMLDSVFTADRDKPSRSHMEIIIIEMLVSVTIARRLSLTQIFTWWTTVTTPVRILPPPAATLVCFSVSIMSKTKCRQTTLYTVTVASRHYFI